MQDSIAINIEGVEYATISQNEVEVSRNRQLPIADVLIPSKIEFEGVTYQVRKVGNMAFFSNKEVKTIVLPNTVTEIGEAAFSCCESLVSVNIPEGVKTIPYEAFYGCQNLKMLFIPDSVVSVEDRAFWNCTNIQTINIPKHLLGIAYPKILPKRASSSGQCRGMNNLKHCLVRCTSGEVEEFDVE